MGFTLAAPTEFSSQAQTLPVVIVSPLSGPIIRVSKLGFETFKVLRLILFLLIVELQGMTVCQLEIKLQIYTSLMLIVDLAME